MNFSGIEDASHLQILLAFRLCLFLSLGHRRNGQWTLAHLGILQPHTHLDLWGDPVTYHRLFCHSSPLFCQPLESPLYRQNSSMTYTLYNKVEERFFINRNGPVPGLLQQVVSGGESMWDRDQSSISICSICFIKLRSRWNGCLHPHLHLEGQGKTLYQS